MKHLIPTHDMADTTNGGGDDGDSFQNQLVDLIKNQTLGGGATLGGIANYTDPEVADRIYNIYNNLKFKNAASRDVSSTDHACYQIQMNPEEHQTYMIATFVIIGIGLLGNGLSIAVFRSPNMRFISSNVYILFRAISDSLYLIVVFITRGLTSLRCLYFPNSNLDIFHRHILLCKVLQYAMDLLADFSCCLVLAFTVERFIACYKPFSYKHICTVSRAKRMCIMLLLLIAMSIFPSHAFFIGHTDGVQYCTVLIRHERTFTLLYMTEAVIYRIFPVLTIGIVNILIICAFSSVHRRGSTGKSGKLRGDQNRYSQSGYERGASDYNNKNSMSSLLTSTDGGKALHRSRREVKQKHITLTLLLVSTAYMVTSVPALVHFLLFYLQINIDAAKMDRYRQYGQLLYISGFSVTFFLFTVTGTLYRNQLRLMLQCKWCRCSSLLSTTNTPGTPVTQLRHSLRLTAVPTTNGSSPTGSPTVGGRRDGEGRQPSVGSNMATVTHVRDKETVSDEGGSVSSL